MISEDRKKEIQKQMKDRGVEIREDNRKVLIAKRREGKTQELIDAAYRQIEAGKNVLWVSQRSQIQRFTINMFLDTNGISTFEGSFSAQERKVKFGNNTSITFKTMEELNGKGRGFMAQSFKDHYSILDNAALDSYDFDLISVNGELYDE